MPVSPAVRADLLARLNAVAPVSDRSMFGGVGLYCEGRFFALIDDDVLYFRVDDATRPEYLKAGMGPFAPFGPEKASKVHFRVPDGVIADKRKLKTWVIKAVDAANRAAEKRAAKKSGAKTRKQTPIPMNAKSVRGPGKPRTGRR
jgi:DNA transformation protein and related proteins